MANTCATRWAQFLQSEGFQPTLEINPDHGELARLTFRFESVTYVVYLDEDDTDYFQLDLGYALDAQTVSELALRRAVDALNDRVKAIKVTLALDEPAVRFRVESFVEGLPSPPVFARSLRQLRLAARDFFRDMKKEARPMACA
jgi:hypothetical protein